MASTFSLIIVSPCILYQIVLKIQSYFNLKYFNKSFMWFGDWLNQDLCKKICDTIHRILEVFKLYFWRFDFKTNSLPFLVWLVPLYFSLWLYSSRKFYSMQKLVRIWFLNHLIKQTQVVKFSGFLPLSRYPLFHY